MKNNKLIKLISVILSIVMIAGLWTIWEVPQETLAYDGDINQDYINDPDKTSELAAQKEEFEKQGGWYVYEINMDVENPFNESTSDKDQINCFRWDFTYVDQNGYGTEHTYRLTMEYRDGRWQNESVLRRYFVRNDDNSTSQTMKIWLPGKLTKLHIFLNMDMAGFLNTRGDRVTVKVTKISCNGTAINTNQDYVSSISNDSNCDIYCAMANSYPMADEKYTQNELKQVIAGKSSERIYDQFGAVMTETALQKCLTDYDGDINQNLSHEDEAGYYMYTLNLRVENPIEMNSSGMDSIEKFYFKFTYKTNNGLGESKVYYFDLYKLNGKYQNQQIMMGFMSSGSDAYDYDIDVWVPGTIEKVEVYLNMSGGERLNFAVQSISCNGIRVSRNVDYVSSAYYGSEATIPCQMSHGQVVVKDLATQITSGAGLIDQYGSVCSDELISKAQSAPQRYVYRYSQLS